MKRLITHILDLPMDRETGSQIVWNWLERAGKRDWLYIYCDYRVGLGWGSSQGQGLSGLNLCQRHRRRQPSLLSAYPDAGQKGYENDGVKVVSSQTSKIKSDPSLQRLNPNLTDIPNHQVITFLLNSQSSAFFAPSYYLTFLIFDLYK